MGHLDLAPQATLQLYQALLYWTWMLLGLLCLAAFTMLTLICREHFHSPTRRPALPEV